MGFLKWIRKLWTAKSKSGGACSASTLGATVLSGMPYEEALAFLKSCNLVQKVFLAEANDDGKELRLSYWNNVQKKRVACGRLHGDSDEVWVQGSYFTGEKARALRDCFCSADRHITRKNPF